MVKVLLEDVATERRENIKTDKNGLPIVGLEHIIPQQIHLTEWDENVENTFTKAFYKGDILFGRRRAYLKKASLAPFDGICSGDITVITPKKDKIAPDLLPFIIQNDTFFDYAVEKSAGSLSPRVKWEHLKNYEFELPSLEEQRKLAKILLVAEETKQAYKNLLQKTDDMVKAKFEEELALCEKEHLGKTIKLGDLTRIRTGKLDANASVNNGKYLFFTCSKDPLRIDTYSYDCECVLAAGNGELNVKYYKGKFDAYQRTYIIESLDKDKLSVPFLYYVLDRHIQTLQEQAIGGVIKYIKLGMLTEIELSLPIIDMQNEFVNFAQQAEKSKQQLQKSLDSLNATMRALINENLK